MECNGPMMMMMIIHINSKQMNDYDYDNHDSEVIELFGLKNTFQCIFRSRNLRIVQDFYMNQLFMVL